ncbi:MAG: NAD-dependent epimerase/dehydratase family protein [Thermodesulfobacteriota bacterium]|nr:NAD-dependent epimerase/dehydratase family protein [Thermodesulfobacteriota bacterium]
MKNILITGANGFIGKALCSRLASDNKVIGIYNRKKPTSLANIVWEQTDLTDVSAVTAICEKYSPDVVIHCAGIAHQKVGAVDSSTYMRVNSESTEKLAKAASQVNPDVRFIFLSSVSVYGEGPGITSRKGAKAQKREDCNGIGENGECQPSSDYACSKLDAERRLIALADEGILNDLIILRLAPVYDREWSFNLNRRVLAPLTITYIRFGSGLQRMSALARPNLVDFIDFIIRRLRRFSQIDIFNVCDAEAYEFNTLIQVFQNSAIRPNRPVISVPLSVVRFATRIAGCLLPDKKRWLYSCYDKLASSLVFDNERMLKTGFRPRHSLQTIFQSTD